MGILRSLSLERSVIKRPTNPSNYMFNVISTNTKTRCEICSKLTIEIPEQRHVNFEHISHLIQMFLLLTLNMQLRTDSTMSTLSRQTHTTSGLTSTTKSGQTSTTSRQANGQTSSTSRQTSTTSNQTSNTLTQWILTLIINLFILILPCLKLMKKIISFLAISISV